jgi:hypothetical protein
VKGASYVDPTARIERQVKLEMLGKMIKEMQKRLLLPRVITQGMFLWFIVVLPLD